MSKIHKTLSASLLVIGLSSTITKAQETSIDSLGKLLAPLTKIKISGYTQFQYVSSPDTVTNALFPIGTYQGGALPNGKLGTNSGNNINGIFQLRRDRIRFSYDDDLTSSALELDAVPTGISIQDAYFQVKDPWTRSIGIRAGSQDRPFGYENTSVSTPELEVDELSRSTQILLPGKKSLGAEFFYSADKSLPSWAQIFNFRGGLFSSTGSLTSDVQDEKDFIARLGFNINQEDYGLVVSGGISGYLGSVRNNLDTNYQVINGKWTKVGGNSDLARRYAGADLEVNYQVPVLGRFQLRGEYELGRLPGTNNSFSVYSPAASSAININVDTASQGKSSLLNTTIGQTASTSYAYSYAYERDFFAGSVLASQDLFKTVQLAYRFDVYDPNWNLNRGEITVANGASQYDLTYYTHSLGLTWFVTKGFQASVYYDIVYNETSPDSTLAKLSISKTNTAYNIYTKQLKDNILTLRLQYRF